MRLQTECVSQKSLVQQLLTDGVFVFKNFISSDTIHLLNNEINKIRNVVMSKIENMKRPLNTYTDIAERELGRLDYRCGFTADIFQYIADPIHQIIMQASPTVDFNFYWGLITALGNSGPTDIHRDVYSVVNTSEGNNLNDLDIMLPPYYFTVLMPLVVIKKENGPTEFIKSSHHKKIVAEDTAEKYAPLTTPGDVVIFDGRTLHRGLANTTDQERVVAYITFIAKWYHDQTFTMNKFLFPELS